MLTPGHLPRQWCEKHKRSGRQMLGDLLIKPHQRITKYPLLLQAVLKRSPEARARKALSTMVGGQSLGSWGLVCGNCSPGTHSVCAGGVTGRPVLECCACIDWVGGPGCGAELLRLPSPTFA